MLIKDTYHKIDALKLANLSNTNNIFVKKYDALSFNNKDIFINNIINSNKIRIVAEDINLENIKTKDRILLISNKETPLDIIVPETGKSFDLFQLHGLNQIELNYVNKLIIYHLNMIQKFYSENS